MTRLFIALLLLLAFVAAGKAQTISPAGGSGGSGTVTSITPGCGSSTSPNPLTTTGTITTTEPVDLETGTNFPIPNGDCGFLVNLSNGSAQTPTIAQAGTGGFIAGWYADVCNIGAGTQTLTPTTSTIGGNASQAIKTGQCIRVVSDGTNYSVAGTGLGASVPGASGDVLLTSAVLLRRVTPMSSPIRAINLLLVAREAELINLLLAPTAGRLVLRLSSLPDLVDQVP